MSDADNLYPCIEEADCISSRVLGCLASDICECDPIFYSGDRCEIAQWGTYVFIVISIPNVVFASLLFYSHFLEIYSRICRLFSFLGEKDQHTVTGGQTNLKNRPGARKYLHHKQIVYAGNRLPGSISDPEVERRNKDREISTMGYGEETESDIESYFSSYSTTSQDTSKRQKKNGIIHIKVNEKLKKRDKEGKTNVTKKKRYGTRGSSSAKRQGSRRRSVVIQDDGVLDSGEDEDDEHSDSENSETGKVGHDSKRKKKKDRKEKVGDDNEERGISLRRARKRGHEVVDFIKKYTKEPFKDQSLYFTLISIIIMLTYLAEMGCHYAYSLLKDSDYASAYGYWSTIWFTISTSCFAFAYIITAGIWVWEMDKEIDVDRTSKRDLKTILYLYFFVLFPLIAILRVRIFDSTIGFLVVEILVILSNAALFSLFVYGGSKTLGVDTIFNHLKSRYTQYLPCLPCSLICAILMYTYDLIMQILCCLLCCRSREYRIAGRSRRRAERRRRLRLQEWKRDGEVASNWKLGMSKRGPNSETAHKEHQEEDNDIISPTLFQKRLSQLSPSFRQYHGSIKGVSSTQEDKISANNHHHYYQDIQSNSPSSLASINKQLSTLGEAFSFGSTLRSDLFGEEDDSSQSSEESDVEEDISNPEKDNNLWGLLSFFKKPQSKIIKANHEIQHQGKQSSQETKLATEMNHMGSASNSLVKNEEILQRNRYHTGVDSRYNVRTMGSDQNGSTDDEESVHSFDNSDLDSSSSFSHSTIPISNSSSPHRSRIQSDCAEYDSMSSVSNNRIKKSGTTVDEIHTNLQQDTDLSDSVNDLRKLFSMRNPSAIIMTNSGVSASSYSTTQDSIHEKEAQSSSESNRNNNQSSWMQAVFGNQQDHKLNDTDENDAPKNNGAKKRNSGLLGFGIINTDFVNEDTTLYQAVMNKNQKNASTVSYYQQFRNWYDGKSSEGEKTRNSESITSNDALDQDGRDIESGIANAVSLLETKKVDNHKDETILTINKDSTDDIQSNKNDNTVEEERMQRVKKMTDKMNKNFATVIPPISNRNTTEEIIAHALHIIEMEYLYTAINHMRAGIIKLTLQMIDIGFASTTLLVMYAIFLHVTPEAYQKMLYALNLLARFVYLLGNLYCSIYLYESIRENIAKAQGWFNYYYYCLLCCGCGTNAAENHDERFLLGIRDFFQNNTLVQHLPDFTEINLQQLKGSALFNPSILWENRAVEEEEKEPQQEWLAGARRGRNNNLMNLEGGDIDRSDNQTEYGDVPSSTQPLGLLGFGALGAIRGGVKLVGQGVGHMVNIPGQIVGGIRDLVVQDTDEMEDSDREDDSESQNKKANNFELELTPPMNIHVNSASRGRESNRRHRSSTIGESSGNPSVYKRQSINENNSRGKRGRSSIIRKESKRNQGIRIDDFNFGPQIYTSPKRRNSSSLQQQGDAFGKLSPHQENRGRRRPSQRSSVETSYSRSYSPALRK